MDQLEATMKALRAQSYRLSIRTFGAGQTAILPHGSVDRLLISQASFRSVYLASLDQKVVKTFDRTKEFYVFSDRAWG